MKRSVVGSAVALFSGALAGCATFAPPSPLATFGGPTTTAAGATEFAAGLGAGEVSTGLGEDGGGVFLRANHGFTERLDAGVDAVYARYSEDEAASVKLALRYQLAHHWRLEAGVGAADSSGGRSTNFDVGLTLGTRHDERDWNWYGTLRAGGAHGVRGEGWLDHDPDYQNPPRDARLAILIVGAQRSFDARHRLVIEGGIGHVDPKDAESGPMLYFATGLVIHAGGR